MVGNRRPVSGADEKNRLGGIRIRFRFCFEENTVSIGAAWTKGPSEETGRSVFTLPLDLRSETAPPGLKE